MGQNENEMDMRQVKPEDIRPRKEKEERLRRKRKWKRSVFSFLMKTEGDRAKKEELILGREEAS